MIYHQYIFQSRQQINQENQLLYLLIEYKFIRKSSWQLNIHINNSSDVCQISNWKNTLTLIKNP